MFSGPSSLVTSGNVLFFSCYVPSKTAAADVLGPHLYLWSVLFCGSMQMNPTCPTSYISDDLTSSCKYVPAIWTRQALTPHPPKLSHLLYHCWNLPVSFVCVLGFCLFLRLWPRFLFSVVWSSGVSWRVGLSWVFKKMTNKRSRGKCTKWCLKWEKGFKYREKCDKVVILSY